MAKNDRFQFSLFSVFVVVTIACFVLANPAAAINCIVSLACLMLGLVCVRSALTNRVPGWISGLIFGSLILMVGTVACILSLALLVAGWRAGR